MQWRLSAVQSRPSFESQAALGEILTASSAEPLLSVSILQSVSLFLSQVSSFNLTANKRE